MQSFTPFPLFIKYASKKYFASVMFYVNTAMAITDISSEWSFRKRYTTNGYILHNIYCCNSLNVLYNSSRMKKIYISTGNL